MSINTRQQEKKTKTKQEKEPKKEHKHKNWYFNFIYKEKPIFLFNTKEVGSLILSITQFFELQPEI